MTYESFLRNFHGEGDVRIIGSRIIESLLYMYDADENSYQLFHKLVYLLS